MSKLQVAVIVEDHPYDVIGFQKMLDSFTDCDCYVQPYDLFVRDEDDNNSKYDTVLYYNMMWNSPPEDSPVTKYMNQELGHTKQGIILLHHALISFQGCELFTQVCGLRNRGGDGSFKYTPNQSVNQIILRGAHPITEGVPDFTLTDETYILGEPEEPGNTILITTDNETSIKNLAWVRQYKNSKVFCYAAGHDNRAYANSSFRKVLHNAIIFTAGR
ncbi:MAG: ThuA domain-containing protein [Defluviitaleaceae bacterium]|nr:ThuA domain-containing protein [Defluviitaleaceae bacterium]